MTWFLTGLMSTELGITVILIAVELAPSTSDTSVTNKEFRTTSPVVYEIVPCVLFTYVM